MPFPASQLNLPFINAMVQAMYQYEARQVRGPELLSRAEEHDFYMAYMGYPL